MFNHFSTHGNNFRERDAKGAELKRRLSLAQCARNAAETRRIRAQLSKLGISA
jgi:hypothetical protein